MIFRYILVGFLAIIPTIFLPDATEANLNDYGRFDDLKATVDKAKAKAHFESLEGQTLPPFKVNIKAAALLKKFILADGFELEETEQSS